MMATLRRIAVRAGRAAARLDDSWAGDAIGAICLGVTFYIVFFFAGILS